MKVLLDSNVIIDAISRRPNSTNRSQQIFLASVSGESFDGYISTKQITDIYYVLRKYIHDDMQRQTFIGFLLNAFNIFPVSQTELKDSLYNDGDYEDNVLIEVAKSNGIDAIITNNCRDFKSKEIKILSPEDVMGQ